jgi:diketogulonate reductase-like aldo/keto reductase
MRFFEARTGARLPVLGQGTWRMGERSHERSREVSALQLGFDLGMTLVDTAEMYANGGSEEVVGEAVQGRRDQVFVVSKVLPGNASRKGTIRAAERSLSRLGIDCIDLYLLHWISGAHPVTETLHAFEALREQGKIRHFGVSNFDVADMVELDAAPQSAHVCANQVYYTLDKRGIERNLLPWCQERGIVVMAYSPLDHGRVGETAPLRAVAARHDVSVQELVLAWTLRNAGVVTVVKSSNPEHVRRNATAVDLSLRDEDRRDIDAAFPRPSRDVPLATA